MNWEIEDPRWTAYLLGELSAEETAEAENILSANPELHSEVENLRAFLQCLQSEIAEQALPVLEPLRKEAVLKSHPPARRKSRQLWFPTAAAALLAAAFGLAHYLTPSPSPVTESIPEMEEDQLWQSTLPREKPQSAPMPVLADESRGFSADPVEESKSLMSAPMPSAATAPTGGLETMKQNNHLRERSISRDATSLGMDTVSEETDALSTVSGLMTAVELLPTPTPTPTPTPEPEPGPGVFQPPQVPDQNPEL